MKKLTIATIALVGLALAGCSTTPKSNLDEFAKCLNDKGTVVYTMTTCGYCQKQKAMFGEGWKNLKEIVCDITPNECGGVKGVPMRVIDGKELNGLQSFEALAKASNCELDIEE